MKRYRLYRDMEEENNCWCGIDEDPYGDYILYADHMMEVGKFQIAIAKQERR
jgi:hypothetical protein